MKPAPNAFWAHMYLVEVRGEPNRMSVFSSVRCSPRIASWSFGPVSVFLRLRAASWERNEW